MVLIHLHTCFMHQIEALDMLSVAKELPDFFVPISGMFCTILGILE